MTIEAETPQENSPVEAREPEMVLGSLSIYGDRAKLFAALAKAQAGYSPIKRSRTVQVRSDKGNYTFDYAPLEEVLASTQPSLNAAGLAWVSMLADQDNGYADLHTLLTHESGAFMHVCESLPAVSKAQERGSQITYRRRYQYQCLTGTSPEVDCDGNAADGNTATPQPKAAPRREPPAPAQAAKPASAAPVTPPPQAAAPNSASEAGGGAIQPSPTKTLVDVGTGEPLDPEVSKQLAAAFRALGYGKGPQAIEVCRSVTGKLPQQIDQADGLRLLSWLQAQCAEKGVTP